MSRNFYSALRETADSTQHNLSQQLSRANSVKIRDNVLHSIIDKAFQMEEMLGFFVLLFSLNNYCYHDCISRTALWVEASLLLCSLPQPVRSLSCLVLKPFTEIQIVITLFL